MSNSPIIAPAMVRSDQEAEFQDALITPHAPGTVLRERYRLTNIVGRGGMGNVYRAEDLRLPGRLCAIKEVTPDKTLSAELREQANQQFLQEASILAQLDHPNLPKVSDFFSDNGRDYLVMDFVPGKDLKQLLDESRDEGHKLTERTVLGWAAQIIDALSYLHRQTPPVVHRDIKPSNIKLTPDGRIKLVDFGLVKLLSPDESRTITVVQGRGTALYTPLEQYGGDSGHTDVRTDIYALGATFYHLLTDYPPPDAKSRFLNPRSLKPLDQFNSQISSHVTEAILWAMEMHPDDRPQTIEQLARALFGHEARPQPARPISLSEALRANWFVAVLALALFLLALVITLM
ncbi:MAG: serine/threonine protein kinase [Candidatus Promineofilum sp.]|nr:serine/threonine protein kinase [Promineifilum sp.]MBP9657489.1 serine/threonine protein kinase [Promineifilum sp.]